MTQTTKKISLPYKYTPRDYQQDFWDAFHGEGKHKGKKYKIFVKVWHRRGGKDLTDWNAAIERTAEETIRATYGFPTSDMSRDNLWESYTNDGMRFTDFVPSDLRVKKNKGDNGLNDSLKRIELITGGSIRVVSCHKPQRLRGGNSKLFVLSEFQAMDPIVIDIIMPIIEANDGILLINMTANGDSAAKGLLESWINDPDVYVSVLTVNDTTVFTPEQMIRIRKQAIERFVARGLSEEEANAFIDQEYYCSWDSPVIGSYFGSAMRRAEEDGRICNVPYEPQIKVNTYWDLGMDDSMSIWFAQLVNREIRCIDYIEATGEGLEYYARELDKKGYAYDEHYAPHDISVRELGTGVSRLESAQKLGIRFKVVKAPDHKEDGINAIRMMIPRVWFDKTKCKRGIAGLKGYSKEWNDKQQVYKNSPKHDWTSHPTDAFQTMALSDPKIVEKHKQPKRAVRMKFHV